MKIDRQNMGGPTDASRGKAKGRRHRERKLHLPPVPWDRGAGGRANQKGLIEEDAAYTDPETGKAVGPNGVRRMRRAPWIVTYLNRGKLTPRQFNVADAIYRASQGQRSEDPLAAIVVIRGMGGSDPQADYVDRRRAFFRLWDMVPTYAQAIVERVVVCNEPIWRGGGEQMSRHLDRLQRGLDHVADMMDHAKY